MAKVKRASPGRGGQAAIETALALTLLIVVGIGAIDFGQAYARKSNLTAAAYRGLRYAVVHPTDDSGIYNAVESTPDIGTVNAAPFTGSASGINIDYYVVDGAQPFPYLTHCGAYVTQPTPAIQYDSGYGPSTCPISGNVMKVTVQGAANTLTPVLKPFVPGGAFIFTAPAEAVIQ